jgi:hypothetical protein
VRVDVLDEVLLLFDQALSAREAVARAKMNEALAERAKAGEPPAEQRTVVVAQPHRVASDQVSTVRTSDPRLRVEPGPPAHPDAGLRTDPATLNALLADPTILAPAVPAGTVIVSGDETPLRKLLR